jgi:hypothetical protein
MRLSPDLRKPAKFLEFKSRRGLVTNAFDEVPMDDRSGGEFIWGALGESFKANPLRRPMAGGPGARSAWGARSRGRSAV